MSLAKRRWWNQTPILFVLALCLLGLACKQESELSLPSPANGQVAVLNSGLQEALRGPQLAGLTPENGPLPGGSEEGISSRTGPSAENPDGTVADEGDDEEPKDYWASIPFSYANFEEVREYVRTYYIEADISESRGFAEAANFALLAMDPPRQLLPKAFYDARKDHEDEEGHLNGRAYSLHEGDPYIVHVIPQEEEDDEPARRLSDAEIREARAKRQARRKLLENSWADTRFGERHFRSVLDHIEGETTPPKDKNDPRASNTMRSYYVAAAQGYLYSLDPHSSLVPREAWEESTRNTTDSSFEGIGAILTQRDGNTIVESPIEGRPAHSAGVRAGDVIIKVDGQEIEGLLLHRVVSRIRGPKGSTVILTIEREGEPEPQDFPIERAHIDIKNVSGRLLGPHHPALGYIKVTGFVPTTTAKVEELYEELQRESQQASGHALRGMILDMRGNSGGLLQQGVKVSDLFLRGGRIVEVKNRVRRDEVYRAHRAGTWDIPLIVLVNDSSASAAEIVASAIQDNNRGLLVGDRTFGKASVQTLFTPILRKDYYIKLTIARYFSPDGRTIQVVGVRPDIETPPDVGGEMPLGFREENLSRHLPPIHSNAENPNQAMIDRVTACAEVRGVAERVHANDPNPQIKFDYQLMKAADYMECYADFLTQDAEQEGSNAR